MANVVSYREDVLFLFCVGFFGKLCLRRRKERLWFPMLSPSDIRPAVREVLLSTGNSLASYQILDRLPTELRDQIIAERGMPGAGQGNYYTAASLVTDAVEGLLPSLDAPHRVYLEMDDMTFEVAGQTIKPGNAAIAYYKLPAPETPPAVSPADFDLMAEVAPAAQIPEHPQSEFTSQHLKPTPPKTQNKHNAQFGCLLTLAILGFPAVIAIKPELIWLCLFVFWPLVLYAAYKTDNISLKAKMGFVIFLLCWSYTAIIQKDKAIRDKQTMAKFEAETKVVADEHKEVIATQTSSNVSQSYPVFHATPIAPAPAAEKDLNLFITKDGFLASTDSENIDKAARYAVEKDNAALQTLINAGSVVPLRAGMRVHVVDHKGFLAPVVKVRELGTTTELWTFHEALKKP